MKRFIAFIGGANSGIQTREKAIAWASAQMTQKTNIESVHIAEVIEVVERVVPAVEINRYHPVPDEVPERKVAQF